MNEHVTVQQLHIIAKIPIMQILYCVIATESTCYLLFESLSTQKRYKIFKQQLASDKQEYSSQIIDTMFRGKHWEEFLIWFISNDIDQYCAGTNQLNYDSEVELTATAYTLCYQGWHCKSYLQKLITNINDIKFMMQQYFNCLQKHISIDWVNLEITKYKLLHFTPGMNDIYSSFIIQNPYQSDCFDLCVDNQNIKFQDNKALHYMPYDMDDMQHLILYGYLRKFAPMSVLFCTVIMELLELFYCHYDEVNYIHGLTNFYTILYKLYTVLV